jgi:hypothetical protein
MYSFPGMHKEISGCDVKDCYHFILLFPGNRCICGSNAQNKTGAVGCAGYRQR